MPFKIFNTAHAGNHYMYVIDENIDDDFLSEVFEKYILHSSKLTVERASNKWRLGKCYNGTAYITREVWHCTWPKVRYVGRLSCMIKWDTGAQIIFVVQFG